MPQTIVYKDQVYDITDETEEHTTKDGRLVQLRRIRSHCARCGELFDFWLSENVLTTGRPWLSRRCDRHKAQGIKVHQHCLGSPEDQEVMFQLGR